MNWVVIRLLSYLTKHSYIFIYMRTILRVNAIVTIPHPWSGVMCWCQCVYHFTSTFSLVCRNWCRRLGIVETGTLIRERGTLVRAGLDIGYLSYHVCDFQLGFGELVSLTDFQLLLMDRLSFWAYTILVFQTTIWVKDFLKWHRWHDMNDIRGISHGKRSGGFPNWS